MNKLLLFLLPIGVVFAVGTSLTVWFSQRRMKNTNVSSNSKIESSAPTYSNVLDPSKISVPGMGGVPSLGSPSEKADQQALESITETMKKSRELQEKYSIS